MIHAFLQTFIDEDKAFPVQPLILTHFDKLYDVMSDSERQELMQALIAEIHIHEQPQPNGQWLKSIKFRLPIIDGDTSLVLDKCDGVETVALFSN